ncbi:MAG: hypothetical protein IJU37_00720 [Desulfovibrio sp.]|nr:hypothetical protein [Desulfovibrio sp.]
MRWTKEIPQQPGWYWLKTVKNGQALQEIVRVTCDATIPKTQWAGIFGSWPLGIKGEEFWAGPIPLPDE